MPTRDVLNDRLEVFSFEDQLAWLQEQVETKQADNPRYYRMLLSLAESVKAASRNQVVQPKEN